MVYRREKFKIPSEKFGKFRKNQQNFVLILNILKVFCMIYAMLGELTKNLKF